MKKRIFIIIALIVMVSLISILTFSKFKSNSFFDYFISSKNFYFESDKLGIEERENVNYMWDGSSISFKLMNYFNNDLVTEDLIRYSVSCETNNPDITCHLNNTSNTKITSSINGKFKKDETVSFDLVSLNDINDVEVYINAKSISPYEKTLKGKFILHKVDSLENLVSYDIVNNKIYSNLLLTNKSLESKCLEVSILDNKVKVFKEDSMFGIETNSNGYINKFNINVNGDSSSTIKLFNSEDNDINKNIITVIECQ